VDGVALILDMIALKVPLSLSPPAVVHPTPQQSLRSMLANVNSYHYQHLYEEKGKTAGNEQGNMLEVDVDGINPWDFFFLPCYR
jgi:hypothetical protein